MEKQPFYLSRRRLPSGRCVYNYYYYNQFGERTVPKSTGCTRKVDAINYCTRLLLANNLANNKTKFKTYGFGFFDEGSRWYKARSLQGSIAKNTLLAYRSGLKFHILPYFENMYMDKITPNIIREFRVYLAEEKELSNKSINNIVDEARIIFDWAVEDDIILKNPVSKLIKPLEVNQKREAFTLDEVKFVLRPGWKDYQSWLFTLTGAMTGLRFSEVRGLKNENIHENYIDLTMQFCDEFKETKTKVSRFIPIPNELSKMLKDFGEGKDYIFTSDKNINKPVPRTKIIRDLYTQYSDNMKAVKNDRVLTFHSLRYFFNTYLLSKNIISQKVDFIIGHSGGAGTMQKLYTSWKPDMYNDVLKVQNELFDILLSS